jgi:proline dehydrogenase
VAVYDRALVRLLPAVPKPVVRRISERYIAGEEIEDAVRVVRAVNAAQKMATIDVLGEEVSNATTARALVRAYQDVFAAIEREGLDANVSVKLTGLGLRLGYDLCRENLLAVVEDAARRSNFVRIDMEDSSVTEDTLRLYRELREAGYENLGIVLQAALRRTLSDIAALADLRPNVRLCKGIYVETPEIAFQDREAIRASFVRALDTLFDSGAYVAIATHDEVLIDEGRLQAGERGLLREHYEFQMLLGVRPERGHALVQEGHRLRIYVPFGRHWYPYSLRRLQENPRIAGYVAADTLARLLPRRRRADAPA